MYSMTFERDDLQEPYNQICSSSPEFLFLGLFCLIKQPEKNFELCFYDYKPGFIQGSKKLRFNGG